MYYHKYNKYKNKYLQMKIQYGGINPFYVSGPISFYAYKNIDLDKKIYLFGDHHRGWVNDCDHPDNLCQTRPDCKIITVLIKNIIDANINNGRGEYIDFFLET